MTLTEFLLARIAEDEASASAAIDAEVEYLRRDGLPDTTREDLLTMESSSWRRPLAECEAKRRIVELHNTGDHTCQGPEHSTWAPDCHTLRALALPYADHEDYREEWAL